jgi:hypothetical protein
MIYESTTPPDTQRTHAIRERFRIQEEETRLMILPTARKMLHVDSKKERSRRELRRSCLI